MKNSKQLKDSVTPKHTMDWYVKWVASVFVLAAMSLRGIDGMAHYDLGLSMIGISLWLWVSFLWNDRALILLNAVGLLFLFKNALTMALAF